MYIYVWANGRMPRASQENTHLGGGGQTDRKEEKKQKEKETNTRHANAPTPRENPVSNIAGRDPR